MVARTVLSFLCVIVPAIAAGPPERTVAEWVIRSGGRVVLEGSRVPLTDISDLPPGDLQIAGVDLTNTIVKPGELKEISGLSGLRELYLPGPSWTPYSDSPLDANDALRFISGLKQLRRLYGSEQEFVESGILGGFGW